MAELPINTHTLYAHYARQLKKANEDLQSVKKYLETGSPNNYEEYIGNLKAIKPPPADIASRITKAEAQLKIYQETAQKAHAAVTEFLPLLQGLQTKKNFWGAPTGKQNEYMYILDEETCQSTLTDWVAIATACQSGGWGMPVPAVLAGNKRFTFVARKISYSIASQTDAVRIWNHNATLDRLTISDPRSYTEAHRDAIQLIPPPLYKDGTDAAGKPTKIKLADQMVGTILEAPIVKGCTISAPNGPLQGIFMSDGLCSKATITGNDITVKGAHAISLAGLLSGTISNNRLHSVPGAPQPRIRLFPLRIGGNMADDGVVCIMGFASGNSVGYQTVAGSGNTVDGQPLPVEDLRQKIPDEFQKIAVGLDNFNYDTYFGQCSSWTVADFKTKDAWGYGQMAKWLDLRVQEYSSGQREAGSPLPPPSAEQKVDQPFSVLRMLKDAQTAVRGNAATFLNTRLADLQFTAIRSFSMKRIAIMNGTPMPLLDLGATNGRREAMLKWLLEDNHLHNRERIGRIDCQVMEVLPDNRQQPVMSQTFKLHFEGIAPIPGMTTPAGRILMDGLPLAPYILRFDDANLVTTTYTNP